MSLAFTFSRSVFSRVWGLPHRTFSRESIMSIRTLAVVGKFVVLSMVVLAVAAANCRNAQAVPIFVPNGSLESPVLSEGGLNGSPSGWVIVAGSLNQQGAFNPTDAQFSGTTGGPAPSPAAGTNIGLINLTRSAVAGSDSSSFTSSASLTALEAGGTYLATVAFGRRATDLYPRFVSNRSAGE